MQAREFIIGRSQQPIQREVKCGGFSLAPPSVAHSFTHTLTQKNPSGIVTTQLVPRGLLNKAAAKKSAAKKRQANAQKQSDNRLWWLTAILGGLVVGGTAINYYNSIPSSGSGRSSGTGSTSSGNGSPQPHPPSKGLVPASMGNRTFDPHFHGNETMRLEQRLQHLDKQPMSCPVLRDKDAVKLQKEQLNTMSQHDYRNKATSPLNPSQGKGHVVGMVGLPGSGKSTQQAGCTDLGYTGAKEFDDIGHNFNQLDTDYRWWNPTTWPRKMPPPLANWPEQRATTSVKTHAARGNNVVMSDPEFVKKAQRDRAEQRVERPVDWAFFENNPEQAKDNAKLRKETAVTDYDKSRNLNEELTKIDDLSSKYDLPKDAPTHPIVNARKKRNKKR